MMLIVLDLHKVIRFLFVLNERGRVSSKENRFLDPTPEVLEIQKESVIFEAIPKTSAIKRIYKGSEAKILPCHTSILNDAQMRRGGITD